MERDGGGGEKRAGVGEIGVPEVGEHRKERGERKNVT